MVCLVIVLLAAEPPRLAVTKELAPNPTIVPIQRAAGGAVALTELVTCPGATSGLMVSKAPALVLDVGDGVGRLDVQVSSSDQLVARAADGVMQCSEKSKLDLSKTGAIELFVVTTGAVASDAPGKIRVLDPSRHRVLPASVKSIAAEAKAPLVFEGELAALPADRPDLQLEVPFELDGLKWRLYGAASEVWVSELIGEDRPPVKLGEKLTPGRYAVWIRGAAASSKGAYAVVGLTEGVTLEPLRAFFKPGAETPLENRALTSYLPGLDPESLKGNSAAAMALRKRAFTELPFELFVFAAADGEVLLPLSTEGGQVDVIAADGAAFSMSVGELSVKPGSGPLVRPARAELFEKLTLEELTSEKDPRVKALAKLRKASDKCLENSRLTGPSRATATSARSAPSKYDEKRCRAKVTKADKAQAKLEADLRKAYAKKRTAELAAVEARLKSFRSP
jgi:hypothetical protein